MEVDNRSVTATYWQLWYLPEHCHVSDFRVRWKTSSPCPHSAPFTHTFTDSPINHPTMLSLLSVDVICWRIIILMLSCADGDEMSRSQEQFVSSGAWRHLGRFTSMITVARHVSSNTILSQLYSVHSLSDLFNTHCLYTHSITLASSRHRHCPKKEWRQFCASLDHHARRCLTFNIPHSWRQLLPETRIVYRACFTETVLQGRIQLFIVTLFILRGVKWRKLRPLNLSMLTAFVNIVILRYDSRV